MVTSVHNDAVLFTTLAEIDSPFEVGVVGAGHISTVYHLPLLNDLDATRIKYVADIDQTKTRRAARHYDAKSVHIGNDVSVLPDCDVALLAVPVGVRSDYVEEFADRQIPIFSEKPFARNANEHEYLLDLTENAFCNYQRTCYSSVRQIRKLIESEVFGPVKGAKFYEGGTGGTSGITPDHYRTDVELSGGNILMEFGTHLLSELVFVFNDKEITVEDTDIIWNGEFEVDVDADIRVQDGQFDIDINYHVSQIKPVGKVLRFEFEDADVTFHPQDAEVPLTIEPKNGEQGEEYTLQQEPEWATTHHQGVYLRWNEFLSYLVNDREPTIKTGVGISQMIENMFKQGRESGRITVQ